MVFRTTRRVTPLDGFLCREAVRKRASLASSRCPNHRVCFSRVVVILREFGRRALPATHLTQSRRREAKGRQHSRFEAPPRPPHLCQTCGNQVTAGYDRCGSCKVAVCTKELVSTKRPLGCSYCASGSEAWRKSTTTCGGSKSLASVGSAEVVNRGDGCTKNSASALQRDCQYDTGDAERLESVRNEHPIR